MTSRVLCALILLGMLTFTFNMQISTGQSYGLSDLERQVLSLVNGTRAYNCDLELEEIAVQHHAFRSGGSAGAEEAAYWIKEKFESFGLAAWLEPFEFTTWDLLSKPSLLIDEDGSLSTTYDQVSIESFQSAHLSLPTTEEGVFADLVILPLPPAANYSEVGKNPINMTEWNAIDTTGKIVLIGKEVHMTYLWGREFTAKLIEQPPRAVVFTWWYDWMSFTPYVQYSIEGKGLYSSINCAVGNVNYEDGLWIRNRENAVNVSAKFSINAVFGSGPHYNVVGKIEGYENPEKMVIISGHYDTVMCSGFCDNGAGTAGVLELAKVMANAVQAGFYKPKYTLLFMSFASEEFSLVGSINYVMLHENEMPNITAVLNLDCIGSDELRVSETDPVGGFDLDQKILNAAQDLNIAVILEPPTGSSDHEVFRRPAWADDDYYNTWHLEAGIADATPVESSTMINSCPLLYYDKWYMEAPGWIHTSYDNSTSTETLNWVEVDDLEDQIKVAALTTVRISPTTEGVLLIEGPYYTWDGAEYWIVCDYKRRPVRLVSRYS